MFFLRLTWYSFCANFEVLQFFMDNVWYRSDGYVQGIANVEIWLVGSPPPTPTIPITSFNCATFKPVVTSWTDRCDYHRGCPSDHFWPHCTNFWQTALSLHCQLAGNFGSKIKFGPYTTEPQMNLFAGPSCRLSCPEYRLTNSYATRAI